MPQITCPNCGMTINLENRKKFDFNLITKATKKKPRTFTDLLHITRLPRKTLSLRLKELCANGALIKKEHKYELNGTSPFKNITTDSTKRFSRVFRNERMKAGFMLVTLLVCFSASGYVLAKFFASPPPEEVSQEPVIIGTFAMVLDIHNVEDLFGWQVVITFNSSELEVLKLSPGGFLEFKNPKYPQDPRFLSDVYESRLLLGSCLYGDMPGKNGSGRLATIVLGYFTENYDEPKIVPEQTFKTMLLDPQGQPIPIKDSTLTLTTI